jgi:hypothetical protein
VRRAPALVVTGGLQEDLVGLFEEATRAQDMVKRAIPDWDGNLVVEAPSSQGLIETSLASESGTYDGIAAVTSSSDGSADGDVGHRILINPEVFGAMEESAAQLVMTHEVVHAATRAPSVPVPLWWAEGFAEYVAFEAAGNDALAGQLLTQAGERLAADLRGDGIPRDVPSNEDFAGENRDVAYEAARRACAVLATLAEARGGAGSVAALSEFQQQLGAGRSVADALSSVFGIGYPAFLQLWRAELADTPPRDQ